MNDDINNIYDELNLEKKIIEEENKRYLNQFISKLTSEGDLLINEIEEKEREKEEERLNMITYILNKTKSKLTSENKLKNMTYDEVLKYYKKAEEFKPWYVHILNMLIGN